MQSRHGGGRYTDSRDAVLRPWATKSPPERGLGGLKGGTRLSD